MGRRSQSVNALLTNKQISSGVIYLSLSSNHSNKIVFFCYLNLFDTVLIFKLLFKTKLELEIGHF